MYFGSVRFFKHLILTIIALLIIVPTAGCIYLAYQFHQYKAQATMQIEQLKQGIMPAEVLAAGSENNVSYNAEDPEDPGEAQEAAHSAVTGFQERYPQLFIENDYQYIAETEKTVYLSFDDGPTNLTPQILNILKDRDVRATFFVVYRNSNDAKELYKRIVDEGHSLGLHSATHNYQQIYRSVEAFLEDQTVLSEMLIEVTGIKPEIMRLPGGSINNYNKEIYDDLIAEVHRRGYTCYDWDVSSGSATNTATKASITSNVIDGVADRQKAIVLLHDAGTAATVAALPGIIDSLKASGYQFGVLDKKVEPTFFESLN